jgi:predicted Zn-dependent protease
MDPIKAAHELEKALKEINSRPLGRRVFLASLPVLLSACATVPKSRYREGSNKGQKTSMTVKDEQNMTREYLPQMAKDYPTIQDPMLQQYINNLGQKIVRSNNLHGKPYSYNFAVVQTPAVNAFALPAGTIFVTAPLLAMADSEAELAGVIGHEIGHVQARHTAERIEKQKKEQNKTLLYTIGGALGGYLLGRGVGELVCPPKDKECLDRISKYGAMAGAAGGLLIQKYAFMANSREDEMEADRIGFRTSVAAGFHKDHVGLFYSKMLEMEKKHKQGNQIMAALADSMSTHPPSQQRVDQMKEMSLKQASQRSPRISSKEFDRVKKRIQEKYLKKAAS